jgi:hypothetical protein
MVLLDPPTAEGYPSPVTSYAVTARIQPVSPHLRDREWSIPAVPNTDTDEPGVIVDAADEGRHTLPSWDDLARAVSETMFFTLDPESWR